VVSDGQTLRTGVFTFMPDLSGSEINPLLGEVPGYRSSDDLLDGTYVVTALPV
jgi:hypothetical protein